MKRRDAIILQLKIRELRQAAGITQKELADQIHYSQAAITKWERGMHNPTIEALPPLARVLGCKIEELFGEEQI